MLISCHCGRVRVRFPHWPKRLTHCNCSICRRYASLWGYFTYSSLEIDGQEHLQTYVWGDRQIAFCHCRHCGCVTHYRPEPDCPDGRAAVNFQMAESAQVADIPVRRFDGADSWRYLD
ncbi:GFA family protein [Ferrimonas marina]|uniref:CENP-V/GFA domain-containing protein n=2 Tax=Ferrimonas marina TaxID=299255 RepID=A0A1M5Z5V5_9GAMM|nr:hypothetical protein SAMN02745129_4707 [Ferrimonas marina]